MKIINRPLPFKTFPYPPEKLGNPKDLLFIDIETTGLSSKYHSIYLIGCCFMEKDTWIIRQWFAESLSEERLILIDFLQFISPFSTLIHFNGNQFDLPFITQRCIYHDLEASLEHFDGIDIYKRIYPYRYFLKLSNCKQKTLEEFLKIARIDTFSGGELISIYQEYCKSFDSDAKDLILQHNYDDVAGMLKLLPILSYSDVFHEKPFIKKVQCNSYRDVNQEKRKELLISFTFATAVPLSITYHANDCYFSLSGNDGMLKVPVYQEELKYFYTEYKDYYYLPEEDIAIHKSVSSYVDHAFREQATAKNCYTRKFSSYLPQWDYLFEPFFKREYKSPNLFFELTEDLKTNREAFSLYVSHILSMMVKTH